MNTEFINKITELSVFPGSSERAIYNLALINEMCRNYKPDDETCTDEIEVTQNLKTEHLSLSDYVASLNTPETHISDEDTKFIEEYLKRNGDHANLKFEIDRRWVSKGYGKTVYHLLASHGISTMNDFLTFMDKPENYAMVKYKVTKPMDELEAFNKIFPIYDLEVADCEKLSNMYDAANEYADDDSYRRFKRFLGDDESKRFINAVHRNGIHNVHQLYEYLKANGIKQFSKLKGIGHVNDRVIKLYNYISVNR